MTQVDFASKIRASVAARREYEIAKNAQCDSMLSNLKVFDKTLSNDSLVALLAASNVDADLLNRAERNNARFNIYAFEKVLKDVSIVTMNHYSKAILHAALLLEASETVLTHADAVVACSLEAKHKDSKRAAIIKKARYDKHVALNTASTQSSSSINSLVALNVLSEIRDAANVVAYKINRESDLATRMIAQFAA
jgi:hypothetical protein